MILIFSSEEIDFFPIIFQGGNSEDADNDVFISACCVAETGKSPTLYQQSSCSDNVDTEIGKSNSSINYGFKVDQRLNYVYMCK